ncbi:MAG: NFACT family protein [Candidatus Woesearchaeota archaeon]
MIELSALDIYFWLKELKENFNLLIDSRIENIYEKNQEKETELIFQLFIPKKEKSFLHITDKFIFLKEEKEEIKESSKFALSLRKHILKNRILEIKQKEFERIIEIKLESLDGIKYLIIEFIKPGNIILCDESYKIIMAKHYKAYGSRLIRPGNLYDYPKKEYNLLKLDENQFKKAFENNNSVVINLAVSLGLGGKYAEELCSRANLDKNKTNINEIELKKTYNEIEKIKNEKLNPISYINDKKITNFSPFELLSFKLEKEKKDSFNQCVLEYYYHNLEKKESKFEKEKKKIEIIIKNQEIQINGFLKSAEENQKKAEIIYEKYEIINNILNEIKNAMQKYSLKEINEKLKDHKIIKEINEKEKTITIEI